jgi:hypothetical protein
MERKVRDEKRKVRSTQLDEMQTNWNQYSGKDANDVKNSLEMLYPDFNFEIVEKGSSVNKDLRDYRIRIWCRKGKANNIEVG